MEILPFEYMQFAKTAPAGARIALTGSGLGPPPIEWLGDARELVDLRDSGAHGTLFLREKIAARCGVRPEEVLVVPGASAAIHLVAAVLAADSAGDAATRAVVERPAYPPLHLEPQAFGSVIRFVDRRLEDAFGLDPQRVASALSALGGASAVWTTNLHNPTGIALTADAMEELAETAARAGSRFVCCEIYNEFLGAQRIPYAAALHPKAVTLSSVTKAFGLGAIRVGWIVTRDRAFLARCEQAFDHIDVNCAMPSLRIAAALFDRIERFEQNARQTATAGREAFLEWALKESTKGRVEFAPPGGAVMAFPKLRDVRDTLTFARRVRANHGVQVTPGEYFSAPGYLRIGFGIDPAKVQEGLAAVSAELDAIRAEC
ncbi:MAG: pyridoxal phosphate-dependent aminotransferase [Planctomycetes bacterium]|nr:pyridoxal phosphate-dependent aminotransferase [Planctomycetota bacterium]